MSFGAILLAHGDLTRPAQLARALDAQGVPVQFHLDRRVRPTPDLREALRPCRHLAWSAPHATPWGSWQLVEASLQAARDLLVRAPEITHVCLLSGQCLPLRSAADLRDHLAQYPQRDFIESVPIRERAWVVDGLEEERFQHHFPLRYDRAPRMFWTLSELQRRLPARLLRQPPPELEPCLGRQWWCLSRGTLEALLRDPSLPRFQRYFAGVWLPDEAFFQTLVRRYSRDLGPRSLTWTPFDSHGRPVMFYDDHLDYLRVMGRNQFFARKIWPGAEALYRAFLSCEGGEARARGSLLEQTIPPGKSRPKRLERLARRAHPPQIPSLPRAGQAPGRRPYRVIYGVDELFPDLLRELRRQGRGPVIRRIFDPRPRRAPVTKGGLASSRPVALANPAAYLTNLLRETRGEPALIFGADLPEAAAAALAADPLAQIIAVRGSWQRGRSRGQSGAQARLRKAEAQVMRHWQKPGLRADVRLFDREEVLADPDLVFAALDLLPVL